MSTATYWKDANTETPTTGAMQFYCGYTPLKEGSYISAL